MEVGVGVIIVSSSPYGSTNVLAGRLAVVLREHPLVKGWLKIELADCELDNPDRLWSVHEDNLILATVEQGASHVFTLQ